MVKSYKELLHASSDFDGYFVVNWCFFSVCNFKCSYCPESLHDGKKRGPSIEDVKRFCKQVISAKKDKIVFFEFTGGEMTYYKDFIPLFEFLRIEGAETGLISNGSRELSFWEKHKHLIDHICLSFHPEQGDPNHFFEVVKILNEVTTVHVNIMMLPDKFEMLYDLGKKISSEIDGPSISMQALFENMSGYMFTYSDTQLSILKNQDLPWGTNIKYRKAPNLKKKIYRGEMKKVFADGTTEIVNPPELIAKQENNWKGWKCNIGLENLIVDFNGNVMRGWCGVGGIIGNVLNEKFNFPADSITCSSTNCHCSLDIMATKILKA